VATAYAFFNNHYAGFAPGSVELFRSVWDEEFPGGAEEAGS